MTTRYQQFQTDMLKLYRRASADRLEIGSREHRELLADGLLTAYNERLPHPQMVRYVDQLRAWASASGDGVLSEGFASEVTEACDALYVEGAWGHPDGDATVFLAFAATSSQGAAILARRVYGLDAVLAETPQGEAIRAMARAQA